jgi:acylphosphatase
MALKRVHLWISGLVQGVSFRYYTRQQANRLGLTGWVRNLSDGRVEVVAEGEDALLQDLVAWCHHGPPSAEVTELEVHWEPYQGNFSQFGISGWGW